MIQRKSRDQMWVASNIRVQSETIMIPVAMNLNFCENKRWSIGETRSYT